jgi:hypothetical protein
MSDELEPFDSDASALLEAGRAEIDPPAGAQARIEGRLARTTENSRRVAKGLDGHRRMLIVTAIAASFAVGVGFDALLRPTSTKHVTAKNNPTPTNPVPPSAPNPSIQAMAGLGDSTGRDLIDEASARLMHGDAPGAIAKLDAHRRFHPNGPLTELREALYVEALARASRGADAHARASEFFAKYPNSLLGPAVEDALGRISDD